MQTNIAPDPLIKNRLDQRMTKDDLKNVRHALYELIIDNEDCAIRGGAVCHIILRKG